MKPMFVLALSILLAVVGQTFFKFGAENASKLGLSSIQLFFTPSIILGFVTYGASAVLYVWCLKFVPLSVAFPSLALGYVLVVAISVAFFHEAISAQKIVGVTLIVAGVAALWK